ncbi:hypothetical protein ACFP52_09425 [Pseudoalteromonas fenneropenaei]
MELENDIVITGKVVGYKGDNSLIKGVISNEHSLDPIKVELIRKQFQIVGDISLIPMLETELFGYFNNNHSEALIIPSMWESGGTEKTILRLKKLRERFDLHVSSNLNKIFDQSSTKFLISPLVNEAEGLKIQAHEYALHELGHISNNSLLKKYKQGVFSNLSCQAIEELRADLIGWAIAHNVFDSAYCVDIFLSTLCLRLGYDYHRFDNDLNPHSLCGEMYIQFLKHKKVIKKENGKYKFCDISFDFMELFDELINWAIESSINVDSYEYGLDKKILKKIGAWYE